MYGNQEIKAKARQGEFKEKKIKKKSRKKNNNTEEDGKPTADF